MTSYDNEVCRLTECEVCGEITFTDKVSRKLELLVNTAKKPIEESTNNQSKEEITVIDYSIHDGGKE